MVIVLVRGLCVWGTFVLRIVWRVLMIRVRFCCRVMLGRVMAMIVLSFLVILLMRLVVGLLEMPFLEAGVMRPGAGLIGIPVGIREAFMLRVGLLMWLLAGACGLIVMLGIVFVVGAGFRVCVI